MTTPPGLKRVVGSVSGMVRDMIPRLRHRFTKEETDLAVHLRGNEGLHNSLRELIGSRIAGRVNVPEPSDPVQCKSMLARDRELQWLLGRLSALYSSPVSVPTERDGEQPE